jgi:hypothetical protein
VFRLKNAVLVVALAGITSIAAASVGGGMISAWVFDDGTANDVMGVNDGIIHGASFGAGKVGGAIDLNGVDNYVEIPHDSSMDVMANGNPVSAWTLVRRTSASIDHGGIVFKGEKIGWGPLFLFRAATVSDTDMTWGACSDGVEGWFRTDAVYNLGEWTHIALTADGATVIGYVNGEIVESAGQANPIDVAGPYLLFPDYPMELGVGRAVGGTVGNDSFSDALIDEVSIWSLPLTQSEIRTKLINGSVAVEAKGKATVTWASLKTK